MGYSLGVDLGTTYTAAAVCRVDSAEVVFLGDRAPQVPSVIYRPPEGPLLLGEAAERHAVNEPERIAREFKRRMGDRTDIYVGGAPMTAVSLSRAMLNWTLEQVIPGQGELPESLTVSCPANWHEFRRELMDQVLAVNVDVEATLCTEPQAAAMHLAASGRVPIGDSIAVYDLGGGTFDACVLRRTGPTEFELGASEGIEHCGGVDFDAALMRRVRAEAGLDALDPDDDDPDVVTEVERLRRDCIEAKEALSAETAVDIAVTIGARPQKVRVTRSEFNELIRPRIEETADCLARALRRVHVTPSELGAVMLVGGSSRIPLVSEVLTERLGRPVSVSSQPKLCVAMGAAMLAAAQHQVIPDSAGIDSGRPSRAAEPATPIPVPQPVQSEPARQVPVPTAPTAIAPVDQPTETPRTPSLVTSAGPPRQRLSWHRITSLALVVAVLAILLLPLGKVVPTGLTGSLDIDKRMATPTSVLPADAEVKPQLLGQSWGLSNTELTEDGELDVKSWQIVLGGTIQARVIVEKEDVDGLTLTADDDWTIKRLLTAPGIAIVLGALFAFAYAESLLRDVRRQRRRPAAGEALGIIGAGAVAGLVVAALPWLLGGAALTSGFVFAVVLFVCASVGLLAFGWDRR